MAVIGILGAGCQHQVFVALVGSEAGLDLSRRRVTLSTSGLVPQIYKLAEEINVALAVSLHVAHDSRALCMSGRAKHRGAALPRQFRRIDRGFHVRDRHPSNP